MLHVIKTLSLGGAEMNLFNLVHAMDPARIETHVAYSWGGELERRFKESGVRLFKYAKGNHRIRSFATPMIVLRLAAYILRNRIEIVHTHLFNAHVWGGLAARLTGRKVVEHVHDFRYIAPQDRKKSGLHSKQYDSVRTIRLSDIVIVLTEQNKRFVLQNRLCPPENVRLIHNGISIGPRIALKKNTRKKIFFTPARMSSEKNIDLLFKVASQVVHECPEVLFVVAGDGPLLETYRNKAQKEKLSKFLKFVGFQEDVREALRSAYALVLPSYLELHPISVLEAISLGVPVVVSRDVGANSEIFSNGVNALLPDPHSPEEWVRALIRLARDPALRQALGRNGFDLCRKEFDIRPVARRIEKLYERLLEKK